MGVNFSDFKGLIPGTMSDLNVLNPYSMFQAFLSGSTPMCQEVTLQTIDNNNNSSTGTNFVTLVDLQNMDPCSFGPGGNPYSGTPCRQAFTNMSGSNAATNAEEYNSKTSTKNVKGVKLPKDPLVQMYFACLGILGIYIVYCILHKRR